jgi:hypothetical protein
MTPSLGRIVLFRSELSNGSQEHPAVVNRVWSDTCVNLTVFPDCGQPISKTSVVQNEDLVDGNQSFAWRWPPRGNGSGAAMRIRSAAAR